MKHPWLDFWRSPRTGILGVLLCCAGSALAQQPVRLNALMNQALTQHPAIQQARRQAEAAGFDVDAAKWGRFPTASAEMRSDSQYVQNIAKVEQPLWSGGRIDGRIELSQANLKGAQSGVREAQFNTLSQVAQSFFEVMRLEARSTGADVNVKEHQQLLELIERRVKSEISPPADLTLAQARLQQAISERIQIVKQLDAARNSLTQWAGPFTGPLQAPRRVVYTRLDKEQALVDRVLAVSAQRDRLQTQIESADKQIVLAKAQVYPTVVAGYQHIVAGPLYNSPDRGRAYMGLQYQTGAGLSALSGIQSAVAKKEAAQQELDALDRTLASQAKSLRSEADALQAQVAPAKDLLESTSEVVDSYLRQYQVGRKNWLDVLNALREKTAAIYNQADIQYSLQQTQVRLLLLCGDLSDPNLVLSYD